MIKLNAVKPGWSIIYQGVTGYNFKKRVVFLSLKNDLFLDNSADTDGMLHYAPFHLGLHCLPKYQFRGFPS